MTKTLFVASEVQAALLNQVLLTELKSGFWSTLTPANSSSEWNDVVVAVQTVQGGPLGTVGFKSPRNYNLMNPRYFRANTEALLAVAQTVEPTFTMKQLCGEFTSLNRIIGGRYTSLGGAVTVANRGQKKRAHAKVSELLSDSASKPAVRKVVANFAEDIAA